jgi:shikimate kinase
MKSTPDSPAEKDMSAAAPVTTPRAIVLVGFMGAGKTSVGRILGGQLGWVFEDLDDLIQAREQRTIEEIFRDSGEPEFRRAEHAALRDVLAEAGSGRRVLALGGGAYVQQANADLLKAAGLPVLFLDAPVEELFRRCEQEKRERPLRQSREQFQRLYESRRQYYSAGTIRIETEGKDAEVVACEIARQCGFHNKQKEQR